MDNENMQEEGERLHNKSGKSTLSLLSFTDKELSDSYSRMEKTLQSMNHPISTALGSDCRLLNNRQGRWCDKILKPSTRGAKGGADQLCYGYQLAAFVLFGRERLLKVPTNKSANSPTLSHICGVEYCCAIGHVLIESKFINDERTHCQYCIKNIVQKGGGLIEVKAFWDLGACNHRPRCFDVADALKVVVEEQL